MKTKKIALLFTLFLIISSLSIINSCRERDDTVSCFPDSVISVQLNLSLPQYYTLQNVGGWLYIDEQQSGTRGLIVYRRSNTVFMIYDRNAPHLCPDNDTTLEVKDGTSINCPKDGAQWFLSSGEPTKIAKTAPKTYGYSFTGNILSIYN
ncbi:MAG: hypothetical protein E2590_09070 [Chryseobacterium sp.]|nr:hypothetical protein [Chryseobacterium sp.]